MNKHTFLRVLLIHVPLCIAVAVFSFLSWRFVFAIDGSGSASVSTSPSTILVNSTGNTLTFVYTASESMSSGGISLTIPTGWSIPQGTSGVAGYTTVSTTGVVGSIFDEADDLTYWTHTTTNPTACSGGFSIDTVNKHSGTGSLKCVNSGDSNNGLWYYSTSTALNWAPYSTIGFWIYTSAPINNGDLKFDYSTNTNLSSPLESLSLGTSILANTWTYVSFNFGSTTRTAIKSYGLHIANLSSMRNATVNIDSFAIGATSSFVPVFSGRDIIVSAITLNSGNTITISYGSGGGASGAVAPSTPGVNTFTIKSKNVDSGTLTGINTSPTVTVYDTTAPTVSLTAPNNATTIYGASVSLTANASDNVAVAGVRFYIDGSLIGAEDTSAPYSVTLDSTTKSDGTHTLVAVARDTSNNYATSTAATVTIDNSAPILTSTSLSSNNASTTLARTGDRITLTFTSNEVISTPTVVFTSGGVTASSTPLITNVSGNTWTASYISTSSNTDGSIGFTVTATDSSGNSSNTSTLISGTGVVFDKTSPTLSSVALASNNASTTLVKVGNIVTLTFTASEAISTPTVSFSYGGNPVQQSVTVTNTSGNNWSATYTTDANDSGGSVTYSISGFSDQAGNSGSTVTTGSGSVTFDKTRPTISSISSSANNPTANSPIPVSITFSENVSGFTLSDISVSNATVSNLSGSGSSYTFEVTPTANGVVTVSVGADAVQDTAGNSNSDNSQLSRTFSSLRPTVSVSTTVSSPTNSNLIHVTVTFSANVTGFAVGDIENTVTNGSVANFAGSGSVYTFDIVPASDGTVSMTIPAGVTVDAETGSNQNFASSLFSISYDSTKPTLSEITPVSTPTKNTTPQYTFNTTEGGTVTYEGGCTSDTTSVSAGNSTVTFSTLPDGNYSCVIRITDSAGNTNSLSLTPFSVDTGAPVVTVSAANPSAHGATIRWSTDESASSVVYYGPTASYGSSTPQISTSDRETPKTVIISDLISCATYHYKVYATDASGNQGSSVDDTFTTRNCAGDADVSAQISTFINRSIGGSLSLLSLGKGLSLNIPANFSGLDSSFQIKKLNKTTALNAISTPADYQVVGDFVYDLHSIPYTQAAITAFNNPIEVSINYNSSDATGLDESTFKIYRHDDSVWNQLSGCSVDRNSHNVTCTTNHFSTFSLFGQTTATSTTIDNSATQTPVVTPIGNGPPLFMGQINTQSYIGTTTKYQFKRFLKTGSQGDDVKELQMFLNSNGFTVATSGAGSLGNETIYFGKALKSALVRFQEAYPSEILTPQGLLKGTGNFFAYTLKFVNAFIMGLK